MMFTSVILIILICIGINYLISNYRKRLSFIQAVNALPGPQTQPIIGNAYYFLQKDFDEFLDRMCLLTDSYSSPCRFWLGNKLLLFISEPNQVKTILQKPSCLNKGTHYDFFMDWLGTGLLTAPAHIWAVHRKIIASSFNTNILRGFCNTFLEQTSIFMEKLEHMTNDEVNLIPNLITYNLDVIYDTSLSIKLESQLNDYNPYVNAILRLKEIALRRVRNIFLSPDIIFKLTFLYREQRKNLNIIHSLAEKAVQQKENKSDNQNATKKETAKPTRKVFLDILMEASDENKKFTRQDILDEINTISFAASDTTTATINFIIFMLANFPEVQQKVYEELVDIYGMQDPTFAPVKYEDLQHMNYMECVIKETLRLFPAVPVITRRLNEDLQIGGYTLPKGADIFIVILALHRNEKYWPKALTFDPDRFLPKNMANIHPNSYMPFSNGPRNCIGTRYAITSMKVFIGTLLRAYILKVDKKIKIEDIKLKTTSVLEPISPLKIRIEKRK